MLPVLNIHGLSVFCIHFIETLLRSWLCFSVLFTAVFITNYGCMVMLIIAVIMLECSVC